jgi:hypothetical protein
MHEGQTVVDAHITNSPGSFQKRLEPREPLEPRSANAAVSDTCAVPVSVPVSPPSGTALYVATNLAQWSTDQPAVFARDVQINDTAYRRLDPEFYAWLRSKMTLARMTQQAGRIDAGEYDQIRCRFNAIHQWAIEHFGEQSLLDAVRVLDARTYQPPVAEPEIKPRAHQSTGQTSSEARALVDAIREQALSLGWREERLYETPKGCHERGLVTYLKPDDKIGEVTAQSIEIILPNGVCQRFYNPDVDQPWILRIR